MKNNTSVLLVKGTQYNEIPGLLVINNENIDLVLERLSEFENTSLVIDSSDFNAVSCIKLAVKKACKVAINSTIYDLGDMKYNEVAALIFRNSFSQEQAVSASHNLIKILLNSMPSKLDIEQAKAILLNSAPNIKIDGQSAYEYSSKVLESQYQAKVDSYMSMVSVSLDNKNVNVINTTYDSNMVDSIANSNGIHVFLAPTGYGKTQKGTLPLFNKLMDMGKNPVMTVPKRTLAASIFNTDTHYQSVKNKLANNQLSEVKGLGTVINSALMPVSKNYVELSQALIIEEFEETYSHVIGDAIGNGTLKGKAGSAKAFIELIKNSPLVIMADAMFSNDSINMIARETGKKINVYIPTDSLSNSVSVSYFPKQSDSIGLANEALSTGINVAAFCDGQHNKDRSKTNEILNSLKLSNTKSVLIDANAMAQEDSVSMISNIDEYLMDFNLAMFTPVINSGVSIQNNNFGLVSFFSHKTLLPNQVIQSVRRFRDVDQVNLSVVENRRNYPLDKSVILSEMMRASLTSEQMHQGSFDEYMKIEGMDLVLERKSFENRMRHDYTNALLIMLDGLGFNLNNKSINKEVSESGKKASSNGVKAEAERRTSLITSFALTDLIDYSSIKEIIRLGEYASDKQKGLLAAHDMYSFYGVKPNADLVRFDAAGAGKNLVRNYGRVNGNTYSNKSNEAIKVKALSKVAEILNIDTETMTGNYTVSDSVKLLDWINNGEVEFGSNKISALEAIRIALPSVSISKVAGRVAVAILKSAFKLSAKQTGVGKMFDGVRGERIYSVTHTKESFEAMSWYKRSQANLED